MLLAGCRPADEINVRIAHPASLSLTGLQEISIRISDVQEGALVHEVTTGPSSLASGDEVLSLAKLEGNKRYVLEITAMAPDACARGRAVGKSLPFEHRSSDYAVDVMVACADQLSRPRSSPFRGRVAGTMAVDADGHALLFGGVSDISFSDEELVFGEHVLETERYDVQLGRFLLGPRLSSARTSAAALLLPDGGVAVIGGVTPTGTCSNAVEVIQGLSAVPRGPLGTPRCWPSAMYIGSLDRAMIIAGQATVLDRDADAEYLDRQLDSRVARGPSGDAFRMSPEVLRLRGGPEGYLVVGGRAEALETTAVSRIHFSSGCPAGGCWDAVVSVDEPLPSDLRDQASAYVSCGDGSGAVYIVGGQFGDEPASPRSDIYCYRDHESDRELARVGALPSARLQHRLEAVRGPRGTSRLLVVGGQQTGDGPAYTDALLYDVTCDCSDAPRLDDTIVFLGVDFMINPSTVVLGDGSVLVLGGGEFSLEGSDATFTGGDEAWLFMPDL